MPLEGAEESPRDVLGGRLTGPIPASRRQFVSVLRNDNLGDFEEFDPVGHSYFKGPP